MTPVPMGEIPQNMNAIIDNQLYKLIYRTLIGLRILAHRSHWDLTLGVMQ